MSSKAQIKKIHTLLTALDIDDDTYREMLNNFFGVTTCKALSFNEARSLIAKLDRSASCSGGWQFLRHPKRFDNLGIRDGMATPKQLRNIEGLWFDVTRQGTRAEGLKALKEFLSNRFAVTDITMLREEDVTPVLNALKRMKKEKTAGAATGSAGGAPASATAVACAGSAPHPCHCGLDPQSQPVTGDDNIIDFSQILTRRRAAYEA